MSLLDLSKPWERLSPEERSLAKSLGSQLAGHPVTERVGHDLVLADRAQAGLEAALTVVIHKPVGIVSSQPDPGQVPGQVRATADSRRCTPF